MHRSMVDTKPSANTPVLTNVLHMTLILGFRKLEIVSCLLILQLCAMNLVKDSRVMGDARAWILALAVRVR